MAPVITAWSAVSPFGHGRDAFTAGVRAGVPAPAVVTGGDTWFPAGDTAHVVPDFDPVERLGRKGTGSMDRTTALAVYTLGLVRPDEPASDGRTGVVLGTTSGSALTQFSFTADSLTRRKPYFVNPAQMPFALMNSAAARGASWHGLTGPNTTLAAGRLSGVAGLRYAARLLRTGRAGGVFVGAAEEYSGARALLERRTGNDLRLGEAAAIMFVRPEPSGNRSGLAEVVALDTRLASDGAPFGALVECLRHSLAGVAPDEVWALAVSGVDTMESEAVAEVLGTRIDRVVAPARLVGDTGAAGGPLGVVSLLALAEGEDAARGRVVVATAVDRDGMAGCVVLRLLDGSSMRDRGVVR